MVNLIKMDLRRLFHSPMFIVSMFVIGGLNLVLMVVAALLGKILGAAEQVVTVSSAIASPFYVYIFIILMFASMINFSYADFAGGYVKNIAGQLKRKGDMLIARFIVLAVHNLLFMVVGALFGVIATVIMGCTGLVKIGGEEQYVTAILTLLIKWMLSMAITAILVFVVVGIRNKVLATVVGVLLGTGSLTLAYAGLNVAIQNMFGSSNVDLTTVMPDSLIQSVDVGMNTAVINSLIVSAVCILIFMALTVKVFNSRDIK